MTLIRQGSCDAKELMDIETTFGSYTITGRLGAGGMGEVYRARDTHLDREVAVKILPDDFADDPERHARFEREAKLLAALNNPNIATLYGLEHLDGRHALIMELVDGEGLDEIIARGPIPMDEALPIALQIAKALEAAHEQGIVHRDLKPANIRLRSDRTVKVLDFGLAKSWEGSDDGSGLSMSPTITAHATAAGVILGTAAYMAPEQARGKKVGRRADIWSFGVVVWEMLTGRKLFDGETVTDVIAAVVTRDLDWEQLPPETPPALRRLLERCLRRNPSHRQPDIATVRLMLADLVGGGGTIEEATSGVGTAMATPRTGWKNRLAFAVVACLALVAGGALDRALAPAPEQAPVVEFQMNAPPETRFYLDPERPGAAVVSPDGKAVAFTAEADGAYRLYVRLLDSVVANPIPGTDGAQYPFWSPDSRSLGFFDGSRIKKIKVIDGVGTSVTLCETQEMKGANWGAAGFIVFAPDAQSELARIPETGGDPVTTTAFDPDLGDDSHRHPHFLPDGRHFLYLARVGAGTPANGVMVGSIEGGPGKLLVHSPVAAQYASGSLLYLREGVLVAQPLDLDRFELAGEAVTVADDVRIVSLGTALAVFSASTNGVLAYQTGAISDARQLVWHDRRDRETEIVGSAGTYWNVAVSPRGNGFALAASEGTGSADIWVNDLGGGAPTRLTFDPEDERGIVWTPDGESLVFASSRSGPYDLYTIDVGGTQPERPLYESPSFKRPCSISPDGRLLMFAEEHEITGIDLMVIPMDGSAQPQAFIDAKFNQPFGVFSPDGHWVAYASNESGYMEVFVAPFPGPGRKIQVSTNGGSWPMWLGDGHELIFRSSAGDLHVVNIDAQGESLRVGTPKSLEISLPTPGFSPRFSASPDGFRILTIEPVVSQVRTPLTVVLNWTKRFSP